MAWLPRSRRRVFPIPTNFDAGNMRGTEADEVFPSAPEEFGPTIQDVLDVKQILFEKGNLPLELIDAVIDAAEYWVRTTTSRSGGTITMSSGRGTVEDKLLLRSWPIGYCPPKQVPPITLEDFAHYPSMPSTPHQLSRLSKDGEPPQNIAQEVLDRWSMEGPPRGEFTCRKVVFTIKSHDQAGGRGSASTLSYERSTTWFDVGLERMSAFRNVSPSKDIPSFEVPYPQSTNTDSAVLCCTDTIIPETRSTREEGEESTETYYFHHELNPPASLLQKNSTRGPTTEHKITWSCTDNIDPDSVEGKELADAGRGRASGTGEFVRNLKFGDVVTLWGTSRFLGWQNNVEGVQIVVYWAV